jgi:hypothetical protein
MIAATKAIVILVDMVIFSSCRKQIPFADQIVQGNVYSPACFEIGFARVASRFLCDGHRSLHFYLIAHCGVGSGDLAQERKLSTTHCKLADPTSKQDGRVSPGHLPDVAALIAPT